MFLFSSKRSIIGIDIGTSYVKAVQLKKASGKKPVLESYGMVNVVYPPDPDKKLDIVKQTSEVLKMLHEKSGFSSRKAVASLPSNVAFVSVLTVPQMSEKELQKSIEYQAKKYIPLPLTDVNLGWQILDDDNVKKTPEKEEIGRVKVLLTAVPKNVIANYSKVMEGAGLETLALEPESLSLIRSLANPSDRSGFLVVDIGAKTTSLSMVEQGSLWATRHLTVGGDSITATIARSMGVSFERAEQMKRSSGTNTMSQTGSVAKTVIEMIKSETQQLVRIAENQGKKITKVLLTGGGSKIAGIEQDFASLGIKIERGDPLQSVDYPPQLQDKLLQIAPQLSVAIGLALREV